MSYEFEATDDLEFGAATCAGCDEITSVVREPGGALELIAPSGSRTQPRRKKRWRGSRNGG
jgi:hypothetical protein